MSRQNCTIDTRTDSPRLSYYGVNLYKFEKMGFKPVRKCPGSVDTGGREKDIDIDIYVYKFQRDLFPEELIRYTPTEKSSDLIQIVFYLKIFFRY